MPSRTRSRKADAKGRVILAPDFANAQVIVERVSEDEFRVRRARVAIKRMSLRELLDGIPEGSVHEEVDTGPPVGGEVW